MSNPHTDDSFMWENKLLDDFESAYDAPSNQNSVTVTDPLVWRITHQSGPAVASNPLRGIDPDLLNEVAAAEVDRDMLTECNPNILSGERVFKGTRVSVTQVVNQFKNGVAQSIVKQDFPQLSSSQISYAENRAKQEKALDEITEWAETNGLYDDYEKDGDLEYELNRESQELEYDFASLSDDFLAALDGDNVNSPSHYNTGNIECIEAIEEALTPEEMRGYFKGNCLKYLWREQYKNGTEDLEKAYWYLGRLIDNLEDADL